MTEIDQTTAAAGGADPRAALHALRDQLIAFTLGTGPVAEAFFVAQRFPNLFRALFAEGAMAAVFVPLFNKRMAEGEAEEEGTGLHL